MSKENLKKIISTPPKPDSFGVPIKSLSKQILKLREQILKHFLPTRQGNARQPANTRFFSSVYQILKGMQYKPPALDSSGLHNQTLKEISFEPQRADSQAFLVKSRSKSSQNLKDQILKDVLANP